MNFSRERRSRRLGLQPRRVARVIAAPFLLILFLLSLPIVLPLVGIGRVRAEKRKRICAARWPCGWCVAPPGAKAVTRADTVFKAYVDQQFGDAAKFRIIRDLHACCLRCKPGHRYDELDAWHARTLEMLSEVDVAAIGEALLRSPWPARVGDTATWMGVAGSASLAFGLRSGILFVRRSRLGLVHAESCQAVAASGFEGMDVILLAGYLLLASPSDTHTTKAAPTAVRVYIHRRAGCNHWSGEDAYDIERGREIARALHGLRCRTIDHDERLLKRRFARDAALLRLIEQARDADGAP